MKNKIIPYSKRSDIEKIHSNWKKADRLYQRRDWSAAIMRAVTSVELAANFVIRKELLDKSKLKEKFVDNLLIWANGIRGKFDKLLTPLFSDTKYATKFKKYKNTIDEINKIRNSIAHSGQFKREKTSNDVMEKCKEIIIFLVSIYEKNFIL